MNEVTPTASVLPTSLTSILRLLYGTYMQWVASCISGKSWFSMRRDFFTSGILHCQGIRHAWEGMVVIHSINSLVGFKNGEYGGSHSNTLWEVDERVADQSCPVESHVVPDEDIPGLLWSTPLLGWSEDAMQCVQETDEKSSVVGT